MSTNFLNLQSTTVICNNSQEIELINYSINNSINYTKVVETEDRIEYMNDSGQLHRIDGPARIWKNTPILNEWIICNLYHREDGPAVEFLNMNKTINMKDSWFYLYGNSYSEQDYKKQLIYKRIYNIKNL